ncbi:hypothetical protein [Brevibacillus marinus]|uniref:hypothetical protein n=1 Tax=Brevibacillus marinus TaxID=2496837 RepID=UPI000F829332|nr:hypothetical protein [Brevibacillus marinus]
MRRPTLTTTSMMKKAFRPGERSLSRSEIVERLALELQGAGIAESGEAFLSRLLNIPNSPVRAGRTEAIIELAYQPHQLFDLAYRYLRDTQQPKTADQIFREVRKRTHFSWNQIARILVLEKDPRFVQYEQDERWFLAEWKLANDHVYEYLVSTGAASIPLRAVTYSLEQEMGLSAKEYVFLPELDDRFLVQSGYVQLSSPEPSGSGRSEAEASRAEAAAAAAVAVQGKLTLEDDGGMNTTATMTNVQQEVAELLRQALHLLDQRGQEMGQEVIARFQESDMPGIEALLREKQQNEQIVLGIKQVLATIAQP